MFTLYIVSTPIGNLKDITLRALEILGGVDLILAEDTRKTKQLLSKYKINRPLESFHEHNEIAKIDLIISKLKSRGDIALVSDAGTPTISDPGFKLIQAAVASGIKIIPIPGPSSILASLVASGLPTDQFVFLGYFPKKRGRQIEVINLIDKILSFKPTTVIIFESPYRVKKTLVALAEKFPERRIVVSRELTKIHEEFLRCKLKEIIHKEFVTKGEFTLLLR